MIENKEPGINFKITSQPGSQNGYVSNFAQINNSDFGFWEFNNQTKEVKWSAGFYKLLGYQREEIGCSYDFFVEQLLYHEDKKAFLNYYLPSIQIRLLTKKNGFRWFELTTGKYDNGPEYLRFGILTDIHQHKIAALKANYSDFLHTETSRIAKVGGWQLEALTLSLSLSPEAYPIFELNNQLPLTLEEVISFFEPDYRQILNNAIEGAIKYFRPFDLNLLFKSAKNKVGWVRCKGGPVIDEYGKCIYLRGILQAVEKNRAQEIDHQHTIQFLEDQNKRLKNFAFMVSHNLRSHTGNLHAMIEMYDDSPSDTDRREIFTHIKSIADSLTKTIEQLNEVVKIQLETVTEKSIVDIEVIFKNVMAGLQHNISNNHARIEYDFSKCPEINYIPAYLESILQNLLTNALKYRHPDRDPIIKCYTLVENSHAYLIFADNGVGIDLDRHGDKVFGMYKTFHQNVDARGIGLYITRNQVEALGGTIKIESQVNVGTTFTIKLL